MSERRAVHTNLAYAAAAAWIVVPSAWGLQALLADDGGGDGFTVLGVLGWAALVAAGALTMMVMLKVDAIPSRNRIYQAGIVAHSLGVLVTLPMFWAVPVWAGLYAIAMTLFAISTRRERVATLLIAGAMVGGIASLFVLTALKVGTPDPMYGDYPIAWTTSFTVVAAGGAVGNFLLGRSRNTSTQSIEVPA